MTVPETKYAKSGNVHIAYQVAGKGSFDIVMVTGFVTHVEYQWEQPAFAHMLRRLATFSRLICFDKRGTG
ncbi:MAG: alpha/beta fold hydrolase, partial [Candidatus Rokuibacteriota bacterium]